MDDGTTIITSQFSLIIIGLIFRVKLKKMDSIRKRLLGMGVDNFISQYEYYHGLGAVKLSNYMDVSYKVVPHVSNVILNRSKRSLKIKQLYFSLYI